MKLKKFSDAMSSDFCSILLVSLIASYIGADYVGAWGLEPRLDNATERAELSPLGKL